MANYNIEINYLNSSGNYDVLYPLFGDCITKCGSYIGTGTITNSAVGNFNTGKQI